MKINVIAGDKRYVLLNKLLIAHGFDSRLSDKVEECNALILPIAHVKDEILSSLYLLGENTVIFAGNRDVRKESFSGKIEYYSENEELLNENARLTAEATIDLIHNERGISPYQKKVFISGFGRIGTHLARMLKCLGADLYVFARRDEIRQRARKAGCTPVLLSYSQNCDIIINTVPSIIFTDDVLEEIPEGTLMIDLASAPGGFERTDRVTVARGLPGKALYLSAAETIFNAIFPRLSFMRKDI